MLGSVILLCICVCLLFLLFKSQRPKTFPPGPRPLPIFGNLLQLTTVNPLKDLEKLSERYGNVFSLYIGGKPVVVLNGVEAMKEALVTKAVDFAGRPQDLMVNHVTKNKGIILADYGPGWREHRRFALMTLRNFGLGKQSMEERILGEISFIIAELEKSVGESMNPQVLFHNASSNIICTVLFGSRYDYKDDFLKLVIHLYTEIAKIVNGPWAMIYDTLPMLRCLPLPFKKAFTNTETVKHMAADLISQHKKTRVPKEPRDFVDCYLDELEKLCGISCTKVTIQTQIAKQMSTDLISQHKKTRVPKEPRDFVDCYLDELEQRGNDGSSFEEAQLVIYVLDLHVAGTDTTSNTLLTAFLYLMTHPEVQEKCQQEIDEVLEGKEQASFEDRHKMPYTQAVIHEAQRIASTVPLSVFHITTRDTELMGYHIPKGTLIIPNLTSVLYEESQWKFPHEFNPSNFLNEQGQFEKPEAFMPFSIGPRMCLGESLARMELFLVVVTLLRRFQFVWPEDGGEPDFTPVFGITLSPKPYRLGVRIRGSQSW